VKYFNVTGLCIPKKHYMLDISSKVNKIIEMVDRGDYFLGMTYLKLNEPQLAKEYFSKASKSDYEKVKD